MGSTRAMKVGLFVPQWEEPWNGRAPGWRELLAMAQRAFVLTKGEVTYAGTAKKLAADEAFIASSYLGEVDDRAFAATLAEETGDLAPPRIDPERVPLVAELPAELREALADLAAERAVAPERLIADLVNEARRR